MKEECKNNHSRKEDSNFAKRKDSTVLKPSDILFNLSEKIFGINDWEESPLGFIETKLVKEAVRLLKERRIWVTSERGEHLVINEEDVDKIFGEKLTK